MHRKRKKPELNQKKADSLSQWHVAFSATPKLIIAPKQCGRMNKWMDGWMDGTNEQTASPALAPAPLLSSHKPTHASGRPARLHTSTDRPIGGGGVVPTKTAGIGPHTGTRAHGPAGPKGRASPLAVVVIAIDNRGNAYPPEREREREIVGAGRARRGPGVFFFYFLFFIFFN
jgi:hypothetical protein